MDAKKKKSEGDDSNEKEWSINGCRADIASGMMAVRKRREAGELCVVDPRKKKKRGTKQMEVEDRQKTHDASA